MRPPVSILRHSSNQLQVGCAQHAKRFFSSRFNNSNYVASISNKNEATEREAAYTAVERHFPKTQPNHPPIYIGIGTGTAMQYVIEAITQLSPHHLHDVFFVPTGRRTKAWLNNARLPVVTIEEAAGPRTLSNGEEWKPKLNRKERRNDKGIYLSKGLIDVAFNGAHEIDVGMNMLKGAEGNLPREKLVALLADEYVVVADERRSVHSLCTVFPAGIPLEVVPEAAPHVLRALSAIGGQNPTIRLDRGSSEHQWVSDNGNYMIDVMFGDGCTVYGAHRGNGGNGVGKERDVKALAKALKLMLGVVEHGIFWAGDRKPDVAYLGLRGESGGVIEFKNGKKRILGRQWGYSDESVRKWEKAAEREK
ncbi:ribose-5-phosphate isomerase rki1 [Rhizina undulata]